ncbi:hypothetical protein [Bartonella sp. AP58NXGY]
MLIVPDETALFGGGALKFVRGLGKKLGCRALLIEQRGGVGVSLGFVL